MNEPPISARALGYAGLIPFVSLALVIQFLPLTNRPLAIVALIAYGAVITSFLGAIHWGLAMRDAHSKRAAPYVWGVIPSLVAWLALLLSPALGLWMLAVLLWACYAVDRSVYPKHLLHGWLSMRLRLTVVASASCVFVAASQLL